ncbi:hypothetical protein CRV02_08360 [Arcobacter sp. CECT 8989]|uniref:hypothetical protein n=1 Tax=Arcobacter sp. CECT 8989 TaxID=2044509 RepID=UPI00100A47BB|nr:hypothetical protein [Arcobacter sp. CECT 8989]RXK01512.1 hypothetical protein CRV02_08360 [Arcobacter sp. CECT 8989]
MGKVTGIVSNSGEDFVDELSTSLTYNYANQVFSPIVKDLNESDSLIDQALGGAVSTLQFGIMNLVIISVTEYAITKTTLVGGAVLVFLKSTNVAKKVRGIVSGALGSVPFVGRGLGKVVESTGSFISKDRELIAKMAMDNSNNISSTIAQERQTQAYIKSQKYRKRDKTVDQAISIRGQSRSKNMDLYIQNFKTGSWRKIPYHKKLYEDCTGQKFGENGLSWNVDFVERLNSYKEFAVSSEGVIFSQAKATVDLLNATGAKLVR